MGVRFCYRFQHRFYRFWEPTWPPKSTSGAPKIDLGAYQNPLLAPEGPQEASRDPFWTILDRSSLDVGPMLDRFRYHVAPSWGFIFRLFEVGHFSEFGKPGGPNGTWKIRVFFPALSHPACCLRGGRFRGRSPLLDPATEPLGLNRGPWSEANCR